MALSSKQLKQLRALLGWTAQQLADKALISVGVINNFEQGKSISEGSRTRILACLQKAFENRGLRLSDILASGETLTETSHPQRVRWGPVDQKPPGICLESCNKGIFIPWKHLKPEVEAMLLPQVRRVPIGSTVTVRDLGDRKDWIVRVVNPSGNDIAEAWFGSDPDGKWNWDVLVRIGASHRESLEQKVVWQVFQRYSDGSYHRIASFDVP